MSNTSENINEIAAALAKAQGLILNPAKDAENPHFKSHYADLAGGLNAVRGALSSNGLAVVQSTRMQDDFLMLDTRLVHSSGQWIESEYPVCKFPARQQEAGSALTYARRYSLFALVGIAGEDDDGNEASAKDTPSPVKRAAPPARPELKAVPHGMMGEDASADALAEMLDALDLCDTAAMLGAWVTRNAPIKDRLTPGDARKASEAYAARKAAINANRNVMAG